MLHLTTTNYYPKIVISSCNPAGSLSINKMVYPKETNSRVLELLNLLGDTPSNDVKCLSEIHINLMLIYYGRQKDNVEDYFECYFHAKQAFINGHNSGLAPYRLIVCLIKKKKFHQAIEVCSIVTDPAYNFSSFANIKKPEFVYKMKKLKRKIQNGDHCGMKLFTEDEVKRITINSGISLS